MTWNTDAPGAQGGWGSGAACGFRRAWHPLEIAAVVIGFMIWWPIGLAVLAFRIAHRRGFDWRDGLRHARGAFASTGWQARTAGWAPFGTASSGNAAFDEWRASEMARLEEEWKKLEAAQREFADHLDNLRKARDREEFDRFMAARAARNGGTA